MESPLAQIQHIPLLISIRKARRAKRRERRERKTMDSADKPSGQDKDR